MTNPSAQTMLEQLAEQVCSEMHSILKTDWDRECLKSKILSALRRAAPAEVREDAFEECAKIADQVAINAERRAAGHLPQSAAAEAAYNKMEGAQTVAFQIRERTSTVTRPTSGGAA